MARWRAQQFDNIRVRMSAKITEKLGRLLFIFLAQAFLFKDLVTNFYQAN
jgi:hypothetical protein